MGTPFNVGITIFDDQVLEPDTKFFFQLDTTDQLVLISPNSSKEINILDDDSKCVRPCRCIATSTHAAIIGGG